MHYGQFNPGIQPDSAWAAEQLFKQALQTLDLSVDDVPDPSR